MGSLSPFVSSWMPEDDLLLKNAIEAGASLESLAKGAVQFSREFTVRELQARWHSLLYDPVISEDASSRIIEFERSTSILSAGNSKDGKCLSGKRKSESVRSCYYAMRKRIRSEPFNSMDLGFLVAPNVSNSVGLEDKPLPGNPISDDLVVQETNVNVMNCSFPQIQESPHLLGENQFLVESGTGTKELHESEEFPVDGLFQVNDLIIEPSSSFDQINNNPENIFSEFEVNQVFNSPILEWEWSIWSTDEGLSASDIPAHDGEKGLHGGDIYGLPGDGLAKSDHALGHNVVVTDSNVESEIPCEASANPTAETEGYLMEITNTLMNDEPLFLDLDVIDVIDKSFFEGLSSLLESSPKKSDKDQITEAMTIETRDNLAKVSCSGLGESDGPCTLNSSPKKSVRDQTTEAVTIETQNILAKVSCSGLGESDGPCTSNSSPKKSDRDQITEAMTIESRDNLAKVSCSGLVESEGPCTLNNEDPEIPCNEDIVLPKQLSRLPVSSRRHKEPLSARIKDFSGGQKANEVGPVLFRRDKKNPGQSQGSSKIKGSKMIQKLGQLHPVVKCEDSPCVAPRGDTFLSNGSAQCNSINARVGSFPPTLPMEKSEENTLGKHMNHSSTNSLIGKPALCSDNHNSFPPVNSSALKPEVDPLQCKDHQASIAALGSMDITSPEPVDDHPPSEAAELLIESDDDVPCFSDLEAMVCNQRRLDPDDQVPCDQEVARYQHEDSKRALIRLEEGSHSCMQRAIASHGAFAILYDGNAKHYIKKPEILLGRTTKDFIADIDLGRRGCDTNFSRRQAIISMDEDGSFHLKNLGKCLISVNGDHVAPGQSLSLKSGNLILIREMGFIFETNQTCVKQYLNGVAKRKSRSGAPC